MVNNDSIVSNIQFKCIYNLIIFFILDTKNKISEEVFSHKFSIAKVQYFVNFRKTQFCSNY